MRSALPLFKLTAFWLSITGAASAQSISFQTPPDGTEVAAGTTFILTLKVAGVPTPYSTAVIADPSFTISRISPLQFSIAIPAGQPLASYTFLAAASPDASGLGATATRTIRVTDGDPVISLDTPFPSINLSYVGASWKLQVQGVDSHGNGHDLGRSVGIAYHSSDSSIATVDSHGLIRGAGPGEANVKVTYRSQAIAVRVIVGGALRGDLNGDGVVDTSDEYELERYLNSPANGAHDGRDLNNDGVIDANDSRILVTLCTYARCAAG